MVKIGFDPTEGVIRLEVIAADPSISENFNNALITYAEERVDNLSQRKRENQVADARRLYQEAINDREKVQEDLVQLEIHIVGPRSLRRIATFTDHHV